MIGQSLTAVLGSLGWGLGAIGSYLQLRQRWEYARWALWLPVALALGVNGAFFVQAIHRIGITEMLQANFASVLLLSTLIGLMGIVVRLSRTLRGVDGFLFIGAALVQVGSLGVIHQPEMAVTGRPWFVSHGLAFALGGAFFIAGGAAGIAYLLVYRMLRQKRASTLVGRVASLESLERFGRRMPILGFPLFTFGILTGFCGVAHRPDIRGAAWYVDMGLVFSIIAWAVYAYLSYCAMYRPKMRGRRAATLATYGLGLIVVAFLFREFLSPMHR